MMAAMLAGPLLAFSVTHSAGTGNARQEFGFIETAAAAESGLAQLREIDVSVNSLLNTRNLMASPEFDRWRTVNEILNSNLRNNCKDYVVLKEALLADVGIKSQRVLVLVRATGELHVVLAVPYDDEELIFDNMRNVLVTMADLKCRLENDSGAPAAPGQAFPQKPSVN